MPTSLQLREQRANVWDQMKAIMERADQDGRDLTAEERTTYDAAEADLDRLGDDITRQDRHEALAKQMTSVDRSELAPDRPAAAGDEQERAYAAAFANYMRFGMTRLNATDQALLAARFVQPENAAGVGTGGAGGYTVPPEFRNRLVETLRNFGAIRQVADHISTTSGANLPWPTVDDTGNVGAILAENTAVTEQDFTFGTGSLDAYMYTSKLVRVSFQLLQDTGFDLEGWLTKALGKRIGRIQNQHFTTGTGTAQPDGVVTSAVVGKQGTTGQTTTVIYDDLVDLIDSLDPDYLSSQDIQWMFTQAIRKVVRKIKDSQNRPLWEPSIQVGVPDTLLGYPIKLNNDMPAPAANAKSILFGDFKEGYVIRDVNDVQVLRLEERYAEFLQVGFLAFQRSDGTQQNPAAYKAYQHSAT